MTKPRVTVVMTVFNAMPYLPLAVESILNQTYTFFKFIIVNDGSSDDGPSYLRSLEDSRITLIDQENKGQHAAANRAIELADTEYIARMDADDISMLDRLEKQVLFLDAHPEVGLVGGQIERLGRERSGLVSNLPTEHEAIVEHLRHNRHAICNATILFRRHLFDACEGYWQHNIAEDWDMFLRMSERSKLANLSDVLLKTRFHAGSINGRRIVEAQLYNEYAAFLYDLRQAGRPEISYDQFLAQHRSQRFPRSLFFKLDCLSIGQYRVAVTDIFDGRWLRGYSRLALSMAMSPVRTFHRATNMIARHLRAKRAP